MENWLARKLQSHKNGVKHFDSFYIYKSIAGHLAVKRLVPQLRIEADVWNMVISQLAKAENWPGIQSILELELIQQDLLPQVDVMPVMECSAQVWVTWGQRIILLYLAAGGRIGQGEGTLLLAMKKGIAAGKILISYCGT